MSKRLTIKNTIVNSEEIKNSITNEFEFMIKKMIIFCIERDGNPRSSAKTDILHSDFQKIFENSFGDYRDKYLGNFKTSTEKENFKNGRSTKIIDVFDIHNGQFNIDMGIYKDDILHTAILLKAPITSINKNRNNYLNSYLGETVRFHRSDVKNPPNLIFVNIIPNKTLVKNGMYYNTEIVNKSVDLNESIKKSCIDKRFQDKTLFLDFYYDICLDLEKIKTNDDFKTAISLNSDFVKMPQTEIKKLIDYINSFLKNELNV